MSLKPFFCYYGGKWRVAPKYPDPLFPTIIEPFAGAAGYSVRHPERQVILTDSDPIIFGVWDFLIHAPESDILILPDVVEHVDDVKAPQEAKWLIGFWLNKGVTSPCNVPGKWMRDHALEGTRLNTYWGAGVKQRIASQVSSIRHWKVSNQPYTALDNQQATWFVDPPYQGKPGTKYRHRFEDYPALAVWSRERIGQVIVCERSGADWLPFQEFATIKSLEGKHGKSTSQEVVWYGGVDAQIAS